MAPRNEVLLITTTTTVFSLRKGEVYFGGYFKGCHSVSQKKFQVAEADVLRVDGLRAPSVHV